MNLQDLNDLDFSNVGNWPLAGKAILIGVLCVVVAFAVVWFDTRHQYDSLEKLEKEEQKLKDVVKVKAARAASLDEYRKQLEEMRQSFGEMRRQLPSQTEVAALLVDISQTGLASGLEFELFQPQPEIQKDFYAELPIDIRVTGSYHEFGKFVSGVAALPRIVTLHNIVLEPDKETGEMVMTATAKTYRYLEEGEVLGQ